MLLELILFLNIIAVVFVGVIIYLQLRHRDTIIRLDTLMSRQEEHAHLLTETIRHLNNEMRQQQHLGHEQLTQQLTTLEKNQQQALFTLKTEINTHLANGQLQQQRDLTAIKEQLHIDLNQYRITFDQHQLTTLARLQESLHQGMQEIRLQLTTSLQNHATTLTSQVAKLTEEVNSRLREISGQVEKRLSEGFEKTTATFTDVIKRLALIDEAQKKITELSVNVVSLQEILADKRSRGAFGEVQLHALIRNVMPEAHFAFQHKLKNDTRVDCILFLPEPSGNIAIDAKFPLESYQLMTTLGIGETERKAADRQFKQDIRKHIKDIASKYITPPETADGAVMFIPAEAIFAEIHAHHSDLVEEAQKARVWMVSPTTMMAVLTTARAVLKDAATRKQVHLIQEHLVALAKDFERFQKRMDVLTKHIDQAHNDAKDVNVSAQKISQRFIKIEKVELDIESAEKIPLLEVTQV